MKRALTAVILALSLLAAPAAQAGTTLIRDAEIERVLRDVSRPVLEAAGLDPEGVRISIISDSRINAFATYDDSILLNTGLIHAAVEYTSLLAVIAHEAAHIASGHVVRRMEQHETTGLTASLLAMLGIAVVAAGADDADVAIGGVLAAQHVARREYLSYTRVQESVADSRAIDFLEKGGTDPAALLDVIEILERQQLRSGSGDPYALTHPTPVRRRADIQSRIDSSPLRGAARDPLLTYRYDRARLKLVAFLAPPEKMLAAIPAAAEAESAQVARAIALHRNAQRDLSIAAMDRLLSRQPTDPYYHELRGQILFESGLVEEAIESYRRASALASDESLIATGLAQALLSLETAAANAEARDILETVVRDDYQDWNARRLLARALARAGDEPRAALLTAEARLLRGSIRDALRFARRAAATAPAGSPTQLRARDLLVALGHSPNE